MRTRIVLVGGGVAGLATAWQLAQRGVTDVLVLEGERELGRHSTGKNASILRSSIGNPIEDALGAEGARFLLDPPANFSPRPLVRSTGLCLVANGPLARTFDAWLESARATGQDVRDLDGAAFRELAPYFRSSVERALYAPDEGRIDLDALVAGYAEGARSRGVRIATGARVAELVTDDARVTGVLLADGTRIAADVVALAAGAWAARLGERAGSRIRLQPTRRHLAVTEPDARVSPDWPIVWSLDGAFYARPEAGGLMLCACDETPIDADGCVEDPRELERIHAAARQHVPDFTGRGTARFWAGMRTFSDDRRFVVGPDPDVLGLGWVAGLGGHGIVCGAAVGRVAAEWLARGEPSESDGAARAIDPRRFAHSA